MEWIDSLQPCIIAKKLSKLTLSFLYRKLAQSYYVAAQTDLISSLHLIQCSRTHYTHHYACRTHVQDGLESLKIMLPKYYKNLETYFLYCLLITESCTVYSIIIVAKMVNISVLKYFIMILNMYYTLHSATKRKVLE